MDCSRRDRICALAILLASSACSVGQGQGEVEAAVLIQDFCELDQADYRLQPTFYAGEVTEDQLDIRIQRGSNIEGYSDGVMIHVRDVNDVKSQRIGLPLVVDDATTSRIQAIFYLNETCPTGFPDEFNVRPAIMEAVSGTITFNAIYAPEIDPGATGIEAELTDLRFEDPVIPEQRNATISGWFSFFYQRGAPAQRFP